jgi:hypothetical protein
MLCELVASTIFILGKLATNSQGPNDFRAGLRQFRKGKFIFGHVCDKFASVNPERIVFATFPQRKNFIRFKEFVITLCASKMKLARTRGQQFKNILSGSKAL